MRPLLLSWPLLLPFLAHADWVRHQIADLAPDEQAYVERINRARADPLAEAERHAGTRDPLLLSVYEHFGVDLDWLLDQPEAGLRSLPPSPPLVPDLRLTRAARDHARDMFENTFQAHSGSDGSTPGSRALDAGYPLRLLLENVFTAAENPDHGHAAFVVDWGNGPRGIQDPPVHRLNILDPEVRDVGVGVVNGSRARIPSQLPGSGDVGPQVVAQLFGALQEPRPAVTGVAYYDLDQDGEYDAGEGIGGARVEIPRAGAYAITTTAGAYGIEVPGDGGWTVGFSGLGLEPRQALAQVADLASAKIDFALSYSPPRIEGPSQVVQGEPARFSLVALPGAGAHQALATRLSPLGPIEAGPEAIDPEASLTTGSYSFLSRSVRSPGAAAAFRLAHPDFSDQRLVLRMELVPGKSSRMEFMSWMGLASPSEIARVEASAGGGGEWTVVWESPGSTLEGWCEDPRFLPQSADLSPFAGQAVRLRFSYAVLPGTAYLLDEGSSCHYGWFFDSIRFADTRAAGESISLDLEAPGQLSFDLSAAGTWVLRARARLSGSWLPYGPGLATTALAPGDLIEILSVEHRDGGILLRFDTRAEDPQGAFGLFAAPSPLGPWSLLPEADFGLDERPRSVLAPWSEAEGAAFYRVGRP